MTTRFHSKYWAHELTLLAATGTIEALSRSIAGARVDLNPHQVDAALFAIRSPLTKGVILADEVGLGKTIEAGIVIAQRWAERKRRILVIVPATLRKQWQQELDRQIREARKTSALAALLKDKLEAQRTLKSLEGERNRKRRELFDAQDAIDGQRDELIKRIEGQLRQRHAVKPVFCFRWRLR